MFNIPQDHSGKDPEYVTRSLQSGAGGEDEAPLPTLRQRG